jgi:hypothetical protein
VVGFTVVFAAGFAAESEAPPPVIRVLKPFEAICGLINNVSIPSTFPVLRPDGCVITSPDGQAHKHSSATPIGLRLCC